MRPYNEKDKPLTLETISNFLEAFDFSKPLPVGHEALEGYQCGASAILNQVKGLLVKHPNIEQTFKTALLELVENHEKFSDELDELWDDNGGGFKGLTHIP